MAKCLRQIPIPLLLINSFAKNIDQYNILLCTTALISRNKILNYAGLGSNTCNKVLHLIFMGDSMECKCNPPNPNLSSIAALPSYFESHHVIANQEWQWRKSPTESGSQRIIAKWTEQKLNMLIAEKHNMTVSKDHILVVTI